MNRILTFWIIAAISGFCVAEPVTKTRLAALHPRDGLVVTDVDMSGMLTNAVASIVTNEVAGGWTFETDAPMVDPTLLEMRWSPYGDDLPGWCLYYNGEHVSSSPKGEKSDTVFFVQENWKYGPNYKCTATYVPARNALGFAMAKDVPTHETVTNTVRKVVNTAGKYLWDAKDEVCWRVNMSGGFVDLVAVTNIDLTLPENHLALEAIENEWRAK